MLERRCNQKKTTYTTWTKRTTPRSQGWSPVCSSGPCSLSGGFATSNSAHPESGDLPLGYRNSLEQENRSTHRTKSESGHHMKLVQWCRGGSKRTYIIRLSVDFEGLVVHVRIHAVQHSPRDLPGPIRNRSPDVDLLLAHPIEEPEFPRIDPPKIL